MKKTEKRGGTDPYGQVLPDWLTWVDVSYWFALTTSSLTNKLFSIQPPLQEKLSPLGLSLSYLSLVSTT